MNRTNRAGDRGRRRIPRVEGLEARELPSLTPLLYRSTSPPHHPALVASGSSLQALTGGSAGGGAGSTPMGQPTPHELARQRYINKLVGTFVVGPGRFSDQAASVFILAQGGSNQASHTNLQMAIFTPANTVNGITTAEAAITGRNVGSTGSTLDLSATAPPPDNRLGIPTHYTWTVGPSSGGLYAASTGQGTMDIQFMPGGKIPKGATGAGRAIIVFKGMVNVVGIFNVLGAPGNRPKHP
jgi:hypothetical protein